MKKDTVAVTPTASAALVALVVMAAPSVFGQNCPPCGDYETVIEKRRQLEQAFSRELTDLSEIAGDQIKLGIHDALEESAQRLQRKLELAFPDLMTPEGHHLIERELSDMMENEWMGLLDGFIDGYVTELTIVTDSFDSFRSNRFETMEHDALAANYIHLWLMLLRQRFNLFQRYPVIVAQSHHLQDRSEQIVAISQRFKRFSIESA